MRGMRRKATEAGKEHPIVCVDPDARGVEQVRQALGRAAPHLRGRSASVSQLRSRYAHRGLQHRAQDN